MGYSPAQTEEATLAISMGIVEGRIGVNRYGKSTNVSTGFTTDLWDRASTTDNQPIWTPPTEARIHQIVSNSSNDSSSGVGAQRIVVTGLPSWDSEEVSETVELNGLTNVPTVNAYVIINFMSVPRNGFGSIGLNLGEIKATADTDGTVTAQINATAADTKAAIYGIPSTKSAFITGILGSVISSTAGDRVDIIVLQNLDPDNNKDSFRERGQFGIAIDGTTTTTLDLGPYAGFSGPAIIKIASNTTGTSNTVSGSFGLYCVEK